MAVARTQVLSKEVSHRFMVRNSSVDGEFNTSVHARLVLEPWYLFFSNTKKCFLQIAARPLPMHAASALRRLDLSKTAWT